MREILVVVIGLLLGGAAFAEDAPKVKSPVAPTDSGALNSVDDCDGGTLQLLECMDARTKPWDKRLNLAYQEALKGADPKQRDPLRHAQRLWVQYRDANCDYYEQGEGSISRVDAAQCFFRMTRSRALELEGEPDGN